MDQVLGILLVALLVAGAWPVPPASAQEERCIRAPDLAPDYEWEYVDQDGVHRFEEVIRTGSTLTGRGQWNVTTYELTEVQDGQTLTTGRFSRFADDGPYPMGLMQVDRRIHSDGEAQRIVDAWDPPLGIVHDGQETCHLSRWTQDTTHVQARDGDPPTSTQRNETWQARTFGWTEVTVPAGTFEAMHVRAVREQDLYTVDTWWSPEARHAVKIERGPQSGPPVETLELAWYILDQRPTARFSILPADPHAGDDVELDATPSFDPDGNITNFRWEITTSQTTVEQSGPTATLPDAPPGALRVRLYVTDDAGRTSARTGTFYLPQPGGSGIAVDGPLAAEHDQIVRLEAVTPFEPLRVQWRVGDQIVGDGQVYSFRMETNTTLDVSALHPSGRTYTAEHNLTLVPPGTLAGDDDRQAGNASGETRGTVDGWPTGGSQVLALLDPLEGQVVEPDTQAEIWTSGPATLSVDGEEVWSGTGPEATVELTLDPGRHTLVLASGESRHEVNVTARGADLAATPDPSADATDADQVPVAGLAVALPVLAGVALLLGSRGRRWDP